jgi:DNA-binding CsgD family transcriptional regulator
VLADVKGPAVVVLRTDGSTMSMTPAASVLLDNTQLASPTGRLALRSLAGAVFHGAPSARARIHDDVYGWLLLDASPLSGPGEHGNVVVTMTPASPRDVTSLLLHAHGLSAREQDVVVAVLAGLSTTEIAAQLYISSNTVQDHLKAVFTKIGVHSRRELAAYFNGTAPA